VGHPADFRRLAEIYKAAARIGKINKFYKELDHLLTREGIGIDDVRIEGASFEPEFKAIRRSAQKLLRQIRVLDPDALVADEEILNTMRCLVETISQKFSDALVAEPQLQSSSISRVRAAS
jgi:hypothetical protein